MIATKVFNSGNSQAMRIPKEYRFEHEDVLVTKVGSVLIAYPAESRYEVLLESLNGFSPDFLPDGRPDQGEQKAREALN